MSEPAAVDPRSMDHLTSVERVVFEWINSLATPLSDWLTSLPPHVWHLAAVGLFVVSGVATFLVPRRYIYADAPTQRAWRDLRLWTAVALAPYIAAYYFLR